MTGSTLALLLTSVATAAGAQVLLKAGMSSARVRAPLAQQSWVELATVVATSPFIVAGLALFAVSVIVWLAVLSRVELSVAYPFVGLGFVLTASLAYFILGERFGLERVLGTGLILAGVVLVARS